MNLTGIKFSIYKNGKGITPEQTIIEEIYKKITDPKNNIRLRASQIIKDKGIEAYKEWKKISIPNITFPAEFKANRRISKPGDKENLTMSGFVIVDIDHIEDEKIKAIQATKDPKLVLGFISPSSNGYKLVYHAPTTIENYKDWWFTVTDYVTKLYDVECDPAGKDITRGCFLSNDKNAYININAESFKESEKLEFTYIKKKTEKNEKEKQKIIESCKGPLPKDSQAKEIIRRYVNMAGKALQNAAPREKHSTLIKRATLIGGYAWTGLIKFDEIKAIFKEYLSKREGDTTPDSEFDEAFRDGWNNGTGDPQRITSFIHGSIEFICAWDGLYYSERKKATQDEESDWSYPKKLADPVWIEGITHDIGGTNCGKYLSWKDGAEKKRFWAMPSTLTQGETTELFKTLIDAGVKVENEPKLQRYFIKYLMYSPSKTEYICTDSIGWMDEDIYVLPGGKVITNKKDKNVLFQSEDYITELKSSGNFEEWQKASKLIHGNSRFVLAESMAFAAPLLGLLPNSLEGGGINLIGASGGGKTTALQIAASVWGNPDTRAKDSFIETWDSTKNGYEPICYNHNHCLLPIDEMGQCDKATVGKTVYMIANGQPKRRMSKSISLRKRKPWKLMLLSTGEKNLSQLMAEYGGEKAKEGQLIRLADVPSDAGYNMGMVEQLNECESSKEFVRKIQKITLNNYGFAGEMFIKKVLENKEKALEKIEYYRENFPLWVGVENNSDACRVADRFALIAAAGELATEFNITGWAGQESLERVKICFKAWFENHGGSNRVKVDFLKKLQSFLEISDTYLTWGKREEGNFYIYRNFFENTFCLSDQANPKEPNYKYHTDLKYRDALNILRDSGVLIEYNGKATRPINAGVYKTVRALEINSRFLEAEILPDGTLKFD